MTGSRRAYAKHRTEKGLPGTTLKSVQKAIGDGRISEAVDATDRIDFERADALWMANTAAKPGAVRPRQVHSTAAARQEQARPLKVNFHIDGQPVDFNTARTATEIARAALLNLELDEQNNRLVDSPSINSFVSGTIIRARDEFRRIGPELRDRIAQETDPIKCDQMITERIEQALAKMAEYKGEKS